MPIASSELILNADGSIYHLNLKPEHLAHTIITVGDPDRVNSVTKYFDTVDFTIRKREFHTQTGTYKGKHITVISTGIGTDNIDIVLNELDALVNIDLEKKTIKKKLTQLDIIRIGTSGSIQRDIPINSFLISEYAIGFDNVLDYYESESIQEKEISKAFENSLHWDKSKSKPYVIAGSDKLLNLFSSDKIFKGITGTNVGFYGPQGRVLRLALKDPELNNKLSEFNYKDSKITNLEMETSAIYGLSKLLGHNAISLNAILANRVTGEFTKNGTKLIDDLIVYTLNKLVN